MDWPGLDQHSSVAGDGALTATNVSYGKRDVLQRRPGNQNRYDAGGSVLEELNDPVNGLFFLALEAGTLKSVDLETQEVVTVSATFNDRQAVMAPHSSRVYVTNGFDPVAVVEDGTATTVTQAGMDGPVGEMGAGTIQGTAGLTAGQHRFRYRYLNSRTGFISNPSDSVAVTVTATETIQFAVSATDYTVSADSKVDTVIGEMTAVNGSDYYEFDRSENTATATLTADTDDDVLVNLRLWGTALGNNPPPPMDIITEHRGRLFGIGFAQESYTAVTVTNSSNLVTATADFSTEWAGKLFKLATETTRYVISASVASQLELTAAYAGVTGTYEASVFSADRDTLYWSSPGLPEGWDTVRQGARVFTSRSDTPTALVSYYNELLIFGQRTMRRFIYNVDPAGAQLEHVPTEMGVFNQRCVLEANGRLMGFGRAGIWDLQQLMPVRMSYAVDDILDDDMDYDQAAAFHVAYDPVEQVWLFFYVPVGATGCTQAVVWDPTVDRWSQREWEAAIVGSQIVSTPSGQTVLLLSDENGFTWEPQEGAYEGLAPGFSGVVLVDTGATDTVVPVTTSVQTSPDLQGVYAYFPTSGETRRVASNTSSALTLASALSTAPEADEEVHLGRIVTTMRTKWIGAQDPESKERLRYLSVAYVPESVGCEVAVSFYQDYSDSESVYTEFGVSDVQANGITFSSDFKSVLLDTSTTVNADGYTPVPTPANNVRMWSFQLRSARPEGDLQLVSARLDTVSRRVEFE